MRDLKNNLECPVDFVTVNENQARLTALLVLSLTLVWLFSGYILIPLFLFSDFILRAFNLGKYSTLGIISGFIIETLSISFKPVDRAPKRFAAIVGVIFSAAILALSVYSQTFPAKILATILSIFAALEAFIGFCAGCYVYTFLQRIFRKTADETVTA
ncbi:MAG: hypothetical protein RLY16_946 [Bacteroidota bacterium]|jgi:hypothetical protein